MCQSRGKQSLDVGGSQGTRRAGAFRIMAARECVLVGLQLQNSFLDGALGDELVDKDRFVLPDAMCPVGRLRLDGGIPPGIVVDDRIRRGEVESCSASLQADEEQRRIARMEPGNDVRTVLRLARQQAVGDSELRYLGFDESQHRGELREKQHSPSFSDQLRQGACEPVQLRGWNIGLSRGHGEQTRVATGLSQLQYCIENRDLAAREALLSDDLLNVPVTRQADAVVEIALPLIEGERFHDLRLEREVFRDRVLGTPQEKRGNPLRQRLCARSTAILHKKKTKKPKKKTHNPKHAGLCEVEE